MGAARIPRYTVLDLSANFKLGRHLRLLGGISNLGDEKYYSRVFFVNGGIEPAAGRSFDWERLTISIDRRRLAIVAAAISSRNCGAIRTFQY